MAVFNVRRIEQTENCFKWLGIKFFQMFWSNRNCLIVDLRCEVIASYVFVVSILICNIFKTLHVSTISLFFLVKQYSSFNLRVKGETDRVFNILTLLHMLCFLDVFLRKSFGFLPVFPLKGKKVPETLTCNKWGSLGVAKLVWNVESLSTWPTVFKNTEMVYLKA